MKRFLIAAAVAVATSIPAPVFATDVGVSISVGQPGFYGRLDIGDFPPPQVIYRQPVAIGRVSVNREPIYLRVPRGHARKWSKHCHEYNACGERVLFVQDKWYTREYVPRYREQHRERRDEGGRDEHQNDRRGREQKNDHQGGNQGKGQGR